MATLTLGQMLDAALGAPKTESIDFEQLRNLLNGMLLHLGLQDLAVQETGEPLEGAERSPFSASFLKELMQKVEASEKEIAEMRTLCQELHEEVDEMKMEQSLMAEDMQRMQEIFDPENFQNMLDELRDQVLESVMSAVTGEGGQGSPDGQKDSSLVRTRPWDDQGLIVIGNEITLLERPRTPTPRHGGSRPISPLPHKARAQDKGKDLQEANASSHSVSVGANDTGQNMGRKGMGWNLGRSDTGQKGMGWNMGRSDVGQKGMRWNMGRKDMGQNVRWSDRGRNDVGQDDMGQTKDKESKTSIPKAEALPSRLAVPPEMTDVGETKDGEIKDEDITISISEVEALPSPLDVPPEMTDVGETKDGEIKDGEIKDEDITISISEVEALPSPLDVPPEMTEVGEIKDGEIKDGEIKDEDITISISKAPPHIHKKSVDGSFTTSGMHPGAPGIHVPVQRVQSVRGHPGSQTLWVPSESLAGTSSGSRLPTPKEARGRGSSRMEPFPAEAGLRLLKVPSSEYSPCDSAVQMSGRYSEIVPSTPPVSPGLSGRLPHGLKHVHVQEDREQAAERYSRRSPRYCGGQHTSTCPVQPMEPLLPDPNKPGAFDLVGRDGLVYRGRTPVGMD